MIIVYTIAGLCTIRHKPAQGAGGFVYHFRTDFLPGKIWEHIGRLPVFNHHGKSVYSLSDRQNEEATSIFRKMIGEKGSGYLFSEELQQTYLVELIHLILKAYQNTLPAAGIA